jgi:hypothetical protein
MTKELTKDDYETITYDHNFQKDILLKTMDLVKSFIQRNKRILVGGMAIDFALRSIGKKLYPDNKFPDYDFLSHEFHKDAYYIGQQITDEISDGVSVIRAFHVSTMRVRVNFQDAADITYIPKEIVDKVPTILYQGFTIVHPHYQMIDQHRALSLPFEKPPLETVLGRWKKDIQRYTLLSENFPIETPTLPKNYDLHHYDISFDLLQSECLSGYASLLYWISKAKELNYKLEVPDEWFNSWVETKTSIKFSLPETAYCSILTDNLEENLKKFKGEKRYFHRLLDKIPKKILVQTDKSRFEILDNKGDLRSASLPYKTKRIYCSNLQEVMCYLLTLGIFYNSPLALYTYKVAQNLLLWASDNYANSKDKTLYEPFLPTVEVYGQHNIYESYTVSCDDVDAILEKRQKKYQPPKGYYPEKGGTVPEQLLKYDPRSEHLYLFDGLECEFSNW